MLNGHGRLGPRGGNRPDHDRGPAAARRQREHHVIPDRIEAGTYLVAGALDGRSGGARWPAPPDRSPRAGAAAAAPVGDRRSIRRGRPGFASAPGASSWPTTCAPLPHPGYPTDMQAQYMALMTQAQGTSVITETIFEHRFMHVGELQRMGADIRIQGTVLRWSSVPTPLTAAQVMATDLRASACLVLAGARRRRARPWSIASTTSTAATNRWKPSCKPWARKWSATDERPLRARPRSEGRDPRRLSERTTI